jgi:hypothetical protein
MFLRALKLRQNLEACSSLGHFTFARHLSIRVYQYYLLVLQYNKFQSVQAAMLARSTKNESKTHSVRIFIIIDSVLRVSDLSLIKKNMNCSCLDFFCSSCWCVRYRYPKCASDMGRSRKHTPFIFIFLMFVCKKRHTSMRFLGY